MAGNPGLIQRYREGLQARHDARRTVATYEPWLRRSLRFHNLRHPRERFSMEVVCDSWKPCAYGCMTWTSSGAN
jgi:hypothetical protein